MIDPFGDFHTHTHYSDGSAAPRAMVQAAQAKGLTQLAITDHMPLPYATRYAMDHQRVQEYRQELSALKAELPQDFTLHMGMEIEYIPRHREWIRELVALDWDILLVSMHTLFEGRGHCLVNGREDEFLFGLNELFNADIQAMVRHYFAALREGIATGWFQVVGHLDVIKKHNTDNRFFNEQETWYEEEIFRTLNTVKKHDLAMEINTSGLSQPPAQTYPSPWIIQQAKALGIPLVLGSDSHAVAHVGRFFNRVSSGEH